MAPYRASSTRLVGQQEMEGALSQERGSRVGSEGHKSASGRRQMSRAVILTEMSRKRTGHYWEI